MKPKIAILQTDGINCDEELFYAFKSAGGAPHMTHVNALLSRKYTLDDFQILALPGGFSYGDDILSAKVLANELTHRLGGELIRFIKKDKLVIGVCNGFQALVRMGYLPWPMGSAEDVSLIFNNSGHFECRWVRLRIEHSNSIFTRGLEGTVLEMPTAHGEGKLVVRNEKVGERLRENKHITARYVDKTGSVTAKYPHNPNGSHEAVAAVCDTTGRIFGIMPHPERNILPHNHPQWHEENHHHFSCLPIFKNAIDYFN